MNRVVRRFVLLVFVVLALSAGSGAARSLSVTVGVYPSGTTFSASDAAPANAASSVSLAMPTGGVDDATILVRAAQHDYRLGLTSPAAHTGYLGSDMGAIYPVGAPMALSHPRFESITKVTFASGLLWKRRCSAISARSRSEPFLRRNNPSSRLRRSSRKIRRASSCSPAR